MVITKDLHTSFAHMSPKDHWYRTLHHQLPITPPKWRCETTALHGNENFTYTSTNHIALSSRSSHTQLPSTSEWILVSKAVTSPPGLNPTWRHPFTTRVNKNINNSKIPFSSMRSCFDSYRVCNSIRCVDIRHSGVVCCRLVVGFFKLLLVSTYVNYSLKFQQTNKIVYQHLHPCV